MIQTVTSNHFSEFFQRFGFFIRKMESFLSVFLIILICSSHTINSLSLENTSDISTMLSKTFQSELRICPRRPPNRVGDIKIDKKEESLETVEKRFGPFLKPGGFFKPKECKARARVAILVPK